MVCTEGKTNKECSYLGAWWDGREQKVTVDVFYMKEP